MLQINPKKFKSIQNKTIPSPMRPKFRNSDETNIYFYSKRKVENEKKSKIYIRSEKKLLEKFDIKKKLIPFQRTVSRISEMTSTQWKNN